MTLTNPKWVVPGSHQINLLELPNTSYTIAGTKQYIVPPFGHREIAKALTEDSFQQNGAY